MKKECREEQCKRYNDMKKSYHLCLSAGDEIMFRDLEDYRRGFNCFAIALYKTGSTGLVEAFMSNHFHLMIQTEDPKGFMYNMRQPYSKFFNQKYGRDGALGEKDHFQLEIRGLHHHLAAMSYILRNPLHHGVAPIPYAYPHSSVNVIFQKEMGKRNTDALIPQKSYYKHIGRRAVYPDTYKMNDKGMFLRESVLDIVQVENMYASPRGFDFYMGRKTSEDWMNEQGKDKTESVPVRLEDIENGVTIQSLEKMLINEHGRGDYRKMSYIDVCRLVDHQILPSMRKHSIYLLTAKEKEKIAEHLFKTYHIGSDMIRRCLAMKV
ncbi:MAG: hypothetical protein J6A91_00300 [Bacteroidales bacterium]|nr:hypothetical protein [Bacteroidales bacterium]